MKRSQSSWDIDGEQDGRAFRPRCQAVSPPGLARLSPLLLIGTWIVLNLPAVGPARLRAVLADEGRGVEADIEARCSEFMEYLRRAARGDLGEDLTDILVASGGSRERNRRALLSLIQQGSPREVDAAVRAASLLSIDLSLDEAELARLTRSASPRMGSALLQLALEFPKGSSLPPEWLHQVERDPATPQEHRWLAAFLGFIQAPLPAQEPSGRIVREWTAQEIGTQTRALEAWRQKPHLVTRGRRLLLELAMAGDPGVSSAALRILFQANDLTIEDWEKLWSLVSPGEDVTDVVLDALGEGLCASPLAGRIIRARLPDAVEGKSLQLLLRCVPCLRSRPDERLGLVEHFGQVATELETQWLYHRAIACITGDPASALKWLEETVKRTDYASRRILRYVSEDAVFASARYAFLLRLLREGDKQVAYQVRPALVNLQDADAIAGFMNLAQSPVASERALGAEGLAINAKKDLAIARLVSTLLRDPQLAVRLAAVSADFGAYSPEVVPILADIVDDDTLIEGESSELMWDLDKPSGLRLMRAAIRRLGDMGYGNPVAAASVLARLRSGPAVLRDGALRALGKIGVACPDVLAEVGRYADSKDEFESAVAQRALRGLHVPLCDWAPSGVKGYGGR